MPVTHTFVSQKADDADATLVRPSNWNEGHIIDIDLTSEVSGILPIVNGGTGQSTSIKFERKEQAFTAQTSVTVTHNNGYFTDFFVRDTSNEEFLPLAKKQTSINEFTVTFTNAKTGTVVYESSG